MATYSIRWSKFPWKVAGNVPFRTQQKTDVSRQCLNIVCYVSLAVWNIPEGWRWTCYYLMGGGYGLSGLCMAYGALFLIA